MKQGSQKQPNTMSLNYLDSMQRSRKKYASMLEPVCRQYELTQNELDVLLFLANNPEYDRAADIVAVRKIAKSHVSLAVTNLEHRGLLARQLEADDRRTSHLKLTDAAQPIIRAGQHLQKRFFTGIFAGLTREELEQWGLVLEKICRNIETLDI